MSRRGVWVGVWWVRVWWVGVAALLSVQAGRVAAEPDPPPVPGPDHLVVSLERTPCMGQCPSYVVSIFDDGTVLWKGKANVGTLGEARGHASAKQLKALSAAFLKARFFEVDNQGKVPRPGTGSSIGCSDTSRAILYFQKADRSRKLEDPRCGGANALTRLEKLVDDTAGTKAFMTPPVPPRLACKRDSECQNSCSLGAVNAGWYREWVKTGNECKDGCAGKVAGTPRCVAGGCVAYTTDHERNDDCTARPLP